MNSDREYLKELAIKLEDIATPLSLVDEEAKLFINSLALLIARIKDGKSIDTEENVPGSYWFTEAGLSQYSDLETAYSELSIFIATGTIKEYEKLIQFAESI